MTNPILTKYQEALEATLGAIAAHTLVSSKESSKTIRDCSKQLDSMSVQLRKTLIEEDKQMVININSDNQMVIEDDQTN